MSASPPPPSLPSSALLSAGDTRGQRSPSISPGRRRPAGADLRRAVLTKSVDPKGRIRRIMQELDENGDGELQLQEIVELFRRVRLEGGGGSACGEEDQRFQAIEDHLKSTFAGADTDGSQGISPSEFLKAVEDPDHPLSLVWEMFGF